MVLVTRMILLPSTKETQTEIKVFASRMRRTSLKSWNGESSKKIRVKLVILPSIFPSSQSVWVNVFKYFALRENESLPMQMISLQVVAKRSVMLFFAFSHLHAL